MGYRRTRLTGDDAATLPNCIAFPTFMPYECHALLQARIHRTGIDDKPVRDGNIGKMYRLRARNLKQVSLSLVPNAR